MENFSLLIKYYRKRCYSILFLFKFEKKKAYYIQKFIVRPKQFIADYVIVEVLSLCQFPICPKCLKEDQKLFSFEVLCSKHKNL